MRSRASNTAITPAQSRTGNARRRGSARACFVAGGLTMTLGLALATSGAVLHPVAAKADDLGSGFDNFNFSASAGGLQVFASAPVGQGPGTADGGVPWSKSDLRYGPTAHALSSIAWPGYLGANLGSLLLVSGIPSGVPGVSLPVPLPAPPPIPEELKPYLPLLNDPIRAEAATGGENEVTNGSVPGATMTARVDEGTARAEAQLAPTLNAVTGKQRSIRTLSQVTLVGADQGVAEARSEVLDLAIPAEAPVVQIQSITSYAKATTDGVTAVIDKDSKTQVVGATVAGIPVTIDEHGVSVNGSANSLAPLTDAVNTALEQSGITLFLGRAVGKPSGGSVNYDAGSLVIGFPQNVTMEIGGAQVVVTATPAGDFSVPDLPTLPDDLPPVAVDDNGIADPGSGPSLGGVSDPADLGSSTDSPTTSGSAPTPVLANGSINLAALPHGIGWGWVAFVVLGAGFIMLGLRRLPDQVLAGGAAACSLTSGANDPVELDDILDLGETP